MINSIPVVGWLLSILLNISLSLPFWLFWTFWEIGKKYFYFVPEQYQVIPFWDCVMLFVVISILKGVFVPSLANVSQTNSR